VSNLITVEDLKVTFTLPEGRLEAVRGVSFRIRQGTTTALVGESGSGKSVVSQSIMGILPKPAKITGGRILFDDPETPSGNPIDLARLNPRGQSYRNLRGGRISIIFQEPMTSLSPVHTVGDQISEAVLLHRPVDRQQALELSREMLAAVGFPDPNRALTTYPFELSGGLRQRAMIAMALVCRPALLIADEPTTALDVTIQAQILKLLRDLQQELDMALLLITHDLGVVANMAEEVVVMYHGQVMESGTIEDIFRDPGHPYLKALLKAVPRFDMGPGERLTPIREIKRSNESGLLQAKSEADTTAQTDRSKPILAVDSIRKTYKLKRGGLFSKSDREILAVDDVGFQIARGECLGLVGESGCGKTTLSKIIMRALRPDSGTIRFNDGREEIDLLNLRGDALTRFRTRLQFIFQDPFSSLNPRMKVEEIIREPLEIHKIGDEASRAKMVAELMSLVGLQPLHAKRYPHSFSGGQRQRIGIARALALRPELIICDEPVSALDVSIQAQILNLLKDLQSALGLTYLFISHNLAVVHYMADRIMVMCRGRIVEVAARDSLFANPTHPYTRALLAAVPEPRLEDQLDLGALLAGRASEPSAWPAPFTIDEERHPSLIEIGPEHYVRASEVPQQAAA